MADFGLLPAQVRVKHFVDNGGSAENPGADTWAEPVEMMIPDGCDFDTAVEQFERSLLDRALAKARGNKTAAAEMLGLKRTTLIMKLRGFEQRNPLRPAV